MALIATRGSGLRVVPGLLVARIRHAGRRRLLVATGLAVAGVLPVLGAALTATTTDAALQRGLGARAAGERSVIVSYNGLPDAAERTYLDTAARRELPRLTGLPVHRQLIFREIADTRGGGYVVGAADDLPGAVRLRDGRLPAACAPTRCEVVSLARPGDDPFVAPELGIVVVGHADRTDPLLLTGTFDPGPDVPVLLADGVAQASTITSLTLRQRTIGWVAGLDITSVRDLGVDRWLEESARVADDLWIARAGLVLTTVDDVLRDENARAGASAGRFTVLGSATAVLLLGTAVVGGAALRRDHEAFVGALRRRGAGRGVVRCLLAGEVAVAAAGGTTLGLAAGAALAAVVAAGAGLPVIATAWASVVAALPTVLALGAAAAALLAVTLVAPAGPGGTVPSGVWRAVEAVAAGCVAVAVLLAARGGVGVAGSRTSDPLLAALPVLVLVAGALLLARVWPALTGLAQRTVPRRALAARLGLAAAAGRPLRPVATAAVLTAAVAASVFAGAYRATLDRGAADQAAYAVPTDARVLTGRDLTRPPDAAPPDVLAQRLPGATGFPVLRAAGSLRVTATDGDGVLLVGVDPAVLTSVARWDAVTGGTVGPADLASRLAASGGAALPAGTALPPGRRLVVATTGDRVRVAVTAVVRADDGREAGVPLALGRAGDAPALSADLTARQGVAPGPGTWRDAAGRPVRLHLVALTVRQPTDEATRTQHALGEGSRDLTVPNGAFGLAGVSVDGAAVDAPWTGWTGTGLTVGAGGAAARLAYRITEGSLVLTPRANGPGSDGTPLAVAVDPATAATARGGLVTIVLDQRSVSARVVAVLPRFPTMPDGRFAVTDVAALGRLVDLDEPGVGTPTEIWVDLPDAAPAAGPTAGSTAGSTAGAGTAAALSAAPFDRLDVRQRVRTEARLSSDPVAVGARGLLAAGALLTLLVAAAALVLLVAAEASDDAAQSYAWEADGVAPGTLRGALWWRAVAVVLPAVPAGVVVGIVLSRATSRLVAVTATAATPQPPLVPGTGLGWGLVAAVGGVALALVLSGAVALRALREPLPVRDAGGLP